MPDENTELRIVSLLEPSLCLPCQFAAIVTVKMADGSRQPMLNCKRLDCDNWETRESNDTPRIISEVD